MEEDSLQRWWGSFGRGNEYFDGHVGQPWLMNQLMGDGENRGKTRDNKYWIMNPL